MKKVELAIQVYEAVVDIVYGFFWNDIKDCADKRKAYLRLKTHGIIQHDRVLNSKVNPCL